METVPVGAVLLVNHHIAVTHCRLGDVDLYVVARLEDEVLAFGQTHGKFAYECGHVMARHYFALPFLDAEDGLRHSDGDVLLHFHLTAQSPVFLLLLAGEEAFFGRQYVAAARKHLAFALSARAFAAAGRRQVHLMLRQGGNQGVARFHGKFFVVVDGEFHVAAGQKLGTKQQKHYHQQQYHRQKNSQRYENGLYHTVLPSVTLIATICVRCAKIRFFCER